uniref:Histone deacetylase 14 n=1 Tax=Tanacetum cinerariifolium TaxID=118510 RepID=A0A6L2NPH0_TANCI|nr:hypothetical protein [Tanacetum cinerariifolium]
MADVNVNAPAIQAPTMAPPTRTDDQIMPHIRWYDKTARCYKCQLYEQWFDLTKNTLKDALHITPVNNNNAFSSPPSSDALINFVNDLGYPKVVRNLSNVVTNDMFQPKHKFHPRPDFPLHLPNEEPVIRYIKFSAKGTKREVFGMPILDNLITADIQGEPYYKEYLEKVAKHQRYLAGEKGRDHDSPALKHAKATKKFKPSAPKADLRPPPSPARRSKPGLVTKRRKPTNSLRLVDESVDEDILEKEPIFDDEEVDVQRALKESLKSIYDALRGPLLPVVIREPESGKYQALLEKKSPADQFVFQRRTFTPTESSGYDESSLLYAELGLIDSDVESDKDVTGIDAGVQDEGQTRPNLGEQDEDQTIPNPSEQDEGQAGPNPGDTAASQPQSSHVVHVGPNLKHMDLEAMDVFTQLHPEQMDEGFNATAYPKTTAETKAESMMSFTIQQDTSSIPPMTTQIIDLTSRPDSPNVHRPLQATATKTITTTTTTHPPPPQPQQSTIDSMLMKHIALEKSMNRNHTDELLKDLAEARKKKKKRHDSPKTPHGSPPHQPPPPPLPAGPSGTSGSPGASGSSQVPPPPPVPPSTNQEGRLPHRPLKIYIWMMICLLIQAHSSDDENIRNARIPKASALASTYSPPLEDSLLAQTGDMAMFIDWFCKRQAITELKPQDLEGPAFKLVKVFHPNQTTTTGWRSIILMLALEQMVPNQMWIEEECKHTSQGDRRAVRTHIRILSVVRIEVFSMYGYDYMKKIVLRRADLNEHIIAERDFKYLYPSDFKDLYLLNLQGHLNHLPPKDKNILTTDKYGVQMIMQFNEIHKFNDGTLHQIDEALDYRVKEFKVNRMNLGLNTRIWTRKDVDRSKEFMFAMQKRLKTRRIFRNLESFVGGRSVGFNSLVHSLHALSTLRRSGLRMASVAVKPCQRDSLELYLVTGSEPLSPDQVFDFPEDELEPHPAYDFFAPTPLPGYAEGQIDAPVMNMEEDLATLFGEDDNFKDDNCKGFDEEEAWEVNEEWPMAPVIPPPMLAVPPPSVYEVGGPSTMAVEGPSFSHLSLGLLVPPFVIEDLSTHLGNLEYRHGLLVQRVNQVSDAEVAADVTIEELGLRIYAVEGQVQVIVSQMAHAENRWEKVSAQVEKGQQTVAQRDKTVAKLNQQVHAL